jgi:hypothetical protein
MGQTDKPFNSVEGYFYIMESTNTALNVDLKCTKAGDIQKQTSHIYRLYLLKTKLKKCLTLDLAPDIKISMPDGVINKDGRIFFIKIVSSTFPDKNPTNT